jgi:hypothetical protein
VKKEDIKTGDAFLVAHPDADFAGAVEEGIAVLTGGDYYHVGIFFWKGDKLWVAEMALEGFRIVTFEDRLGDCDGKPHIGAAPSVLRAQPARVFDAIEAFAADGSLHPYGFSTLLKVGLSDDLGVHYDPFKEQPVCSLLYERIFLDVVEGNLDRLWSPNDVAKICQRIDAW